MARSVAFASISQACVCRQCTHRHVYKEAATIILGKNSFWPQLYKCQSFAHVIHLRNKHCLWPYAPPHTCKRKDWWHCPYKTLSYSLQHMPSEMATLNIIEILWPLRSFSTKLVLARHTNMHYTYTATHILVDMMRLYHTYVSPHYGIPTARFQSRRRSVPGTQVCFPTLHNHGPVHTVVTPANSKRQVLHTPKEAEGHCIFSHQHHAICTRYYILQVLV